MGRNTAMTLGLPTTWATTTDGEAGSARTFRIKALLVVLWLLSLADLAFTLWAHRFTPFVEGNPIARQLLAGGAWSGVVLLKLTSVGVGTLIFWRLRRHLAAEVGLWLVVLTLATVAVLWTRYTRHSVTDGSWVNVSHMVEGGDAMRPGPVWVVTGD